MDTTGNGLPMSVPNPSPVSTIPLSPKPETDAAQSPVDRKETAEDHINNDIPKNEAHDPEVPPGIRQMETITSTWNKKWLFAAYAMYR